jgi:hypothetical protein
MRHMTTPFRKSLIFYIGVILPLIGMVLGAFSTWLSFGMASLGHGWGEPLMFTWSSVYTSGLSGVAWWCRRYPAGTVIAILVLLFTVMSDVCFGLSNPLGDKIHFHRIWDKYPEDVYAWAVSWGVVQLVVVIPFCSLTLWHGRKQGFL